MLLLIPGWLSIAVAEELPVGPDDSPQRERIAAKLQELSRDRKPDEVLKAIAEWKEREPESPDPYVAAANYHYNLATDAPGVWIEATKPEKARPPKEREADDAGEKSDQFAIVDPKTGKQVGTMGPGPK